MSEKIFACMTWTCYMLHMIDLQKARAFASHYLLYQHIDFRETPAKNGWFIIQIGTVISLLILLLNSNKSGGLQREKNLCYNKTIRSLSLLVSSLNSSIILLDTWQQYEYSFKKSCSGCFTMNIYLAILWTIAKGYGYCQPKKSDNVSTSIYQHILFVSSPSSPSRSLF